MSCGNRSARFGFLVLVALCCSGQTQVNLSPTTVPAAGQAGVTSVDLTGTGYPVGAILPAGIDVKLEPSAGGPAVTATPTAVTTIVGTTRRITFLIPASINVANPAEYLVSVSGKTSAGVQFASSNKARVTINRGPAISSVNPNSAVAGTTVTVNINGLFTNFVAGSTQASFGPGISVGSAAPGGFGPVTVNGDTRATAQLSISGNAAIGSRDVTVRTGVQTATFTGGFRVTAAGSGTISTLGITPSSIPYGVPTSVAVTTTITGTPDADSVMLQRLDSAGRVLAIVGGLHDDGLNGDATANDSIFTLASTFKEFAVGQVSLRVSATFNGSPNLVFSPVGTLNVTGTPPPPVTITAPSNLSYLNISPTTVSGTVAGSVSQIVINSITAPVVNGAFTASIPLAEGPNIVTATATAPSGSTGSASITVTLDTTPPHITITSPTDQFVTTASSISVAGNVNDIVVGTVNNQQARVTVNGTAAQVANRTFLAQSVSLAMGSNTIRAVAVDRAGNSVSTQITVTRQAPQPGQIQLLSGDNQTGTIGTNLAVPLAVSLADASGAPAVNKQVIFAVTQNNGVLTSGSPSVGLPAANVVAITNAHGQATAIWKLGMRSGAGSDSVQAYSVGYAGTAVFTATANQGTPGMIVVDSGNNQTGAVNQALPKPLIAVVVDAGHNRLANVPVTFTVKGGGGSLGGQSTFTVNTDPDGRAAATPTLGFQEGTANHLFSADFPGNTGFAANFTASGRGPGDPAKTQISCLVLDNSNQPIPGVTVRAALTNVVNSNLSAVQAADTVRTDAKGAFVIYKAPVGFVKLLVDGSTATVPGTFPTLDYDMVTVPGQINNVGQPIYLLPIKTTNQLCVAATTGGGTLMIPEAPGFSLTFGPGQVTFPGGSKTGCISVTVVNPDKVPMVPGFGQQPRFIVTIQPSGALFNPPAPITLPNVDGLAPREVTEMYSYDHDISSFVAIGTGTVSDDGQVIRSNPGVGVLKAGWHCGGNSTAIGAAATCGPCAFCDGQNCQPNPVQGNTCQNACLVGGSGTCRNGYCEGEFLPEGTPCGAGGRCDGRGNCGYPCIGPNCTCTGPNCGGCGNCNSGNPCIDDSCSNSQCVATPNRFCEDACGGRTSGACSVGNLTGTCDATGNCNLCGALGPGSSCVSGGVVGVCTNSGECCVSGSCLSVTVGLSVTNAVVGEALSATAHGAPATNGDYSWQIIADSGTRSDFVKFIVSPPDNCLGQATCTAPLMPEHPGTGILRVTFRSTVSGQQVSADARLISYHRGLIILFQGGSGGVGQTGFAGLSGLIQTTFANSVFSTVIPPGSTISTGLSDQELAAKAWLSQYTSLYPNAKVMLFGFSFGGDTVTRSTITSELVISLDPISHALVLQVPPVYDQSAITVPRLASTQVNYYQSVGGCGGVPLKGYFVSGATNVSLNYLNEGHCEVDDDASVQQLIVGQMKQVLGR